MLARLIMLCAGMMFTVTVRLKDGGFKGEKILLFKFLAMLSAPPTSSTSLHSGSYLQQTQDPSAPSWDLDVCRAFKGENTA